MTRCISPIIDGRLRSNFVKVPQAIQGCSGIRIFGRLIRSFLFSTDVAIIRNCDADAVLAVYPFTPQPMITHALMLAADKPVICGVGGGLTSGNRSLAIARDAEFQGALGVVLNAPTENELIARMSQELEIPVIVTVVSEDTDFSARIAVGVSIFNVSGGTETARIVHKIRAVSRTIPIIATGGRQEDTVRSVIESGANAISYTPPSTLELFRPMMEKYRSSAAKSRP